MARPRLFCIMAQWGGHTRSTYARHRIRHGIRHTAALVGRRPRPPVTNGCLRHMLIGYARVCGRLMHQRPVLGMSRPLLKLGGGSGEILRDVHV